MKNFTKFTHAIVLLLLVTASDVKATTSTITSNFNGTSISPGNKIWFSSVVKINGMASYPLTIYFIGQSISSSGFTLTVPDGELILDASVTTTTTVFNGTNWVTTAPPNESGNYFISGYCDSLTSALAGGLSPVSWTGTFMASMSGISLNWQWAAAVYTSFNTNLNNLGIKPSDCSSCSSYSNSDAAGTPETYKSYVTGGAMGGGGSNYTGGLSGTGAASPACGNLPVSMCAATTVTLNPATAGTWSSSNTAVATVTNSGVVTGVSAGNAQVTYMMCGTTSTTAITVNAAPTSSGATNSGPICNGGTLTLNANSSNATAWLWKGPNSFTSTIQNPVAAPTATATYSLTLSNTATGCSSSVVYVTSATVYTAPTALPTNNGAICNGGTVTLTANGAGDASGYLWSGPGLSSATVANPTATPSATSTYSLIVSRSPGTSGCTSAIIYTTTVTVNVSPSASPTNNGPICNGGSVTLAANGSGGASSYLWSGPNLSSATAANPTAAPTVTATYSLTVSSTGIGCNPLRVYTTTITVNARPSASPTNNGPICNGGTIILTANGGAGASSYLWSGPGLSSATAANPTATPTATAIYSLTISSAGSGCNPSTIYTTSVTVYTAPTASPTNSGPICNGGTVTLTANGGGDASGYLWSGPGLSSATVASPTATPSVTGTYSLTVSRSPGTSGCTSATIYTTTVNVNPLPNAGTISGGTTICAGATTTLGDGASGGVWSSGATGVASVNSGGVVTGVSAGAATISYTVSNSCGTANATSVVNVNPLPVAGTISGGATVCAGVTATFGDGAGGGVWSSGAAGVASVNSGGLVTGVSAGAATISYTVTNSCGTANATSMVNVNPLPNAGTISGGTTVCAGATTTLGDGAGGGVWSSGATGVASVNSGGVVTGVSAGAATISYTVTNSCGTANATSVVNVNPLPVAGTISGGTTVCAGAATTLNDGTGGGVWSSGATGVASVNSGGVVTGVSAGAATISYTVANSCGSANATSVVNVNPLPVAGTISGGTTVCAGATTTLGDGAGGGVWSSGAAGVASVNSGGVVTGVSAGVATISYTVANSCGSANATSVVNVNPLPNAGTISGGTTVCAGATTTLGDGAGGGVWSSGATGVASVNSGGVVTGVSAGAATITYTVTNSCGSANATSVVNVNPLPVAGTISGGTTVCAGATTTLGDGAGGGVWSSGAAGVASVNSGGVVTGVSAGAATISYTVANSCGTANATSVVNVNPLPNAGTISGGTTVCAGATTTLNDGAGGGVWSSGATGVASVNSGGVVTGVSAGAATISYTVANSCGSANATSVVNVNPLPNAGTISGGTTVCAGVTTTLNDGASGGVWSSGAAGVASVNSGGLVTGVSAGAATISYTVTNSCGSANATSVVNVNPLPVAGTISGGTTVCAGTTTTLADGASGGAWSSGATGVASVNSGGVVTGVSAGVATISYTVSNSCGTANATSMVNVNPLPNAGTISGGTTVCAGATTTLGDGAGGGVWSSGATGVASVNSGGVVTGVSAGAATISYTVTNSCGTANATSVVNVNPLPVAGTISGGTTVCAGAATTLNDGTGGGVWSSGATGVASVNSGGVVTGVSAGAATISYTVANSCGSANATSVVNVNPLPVAGTISGGTTVCAGSSITMGDCAAGGVWSSSEVGIATVNSMGLVTGVSSGAATISYTVTNSCGTATTTNTVMVNAVPAGISGPSVVNPGSNISLTVSGGTWASSSTSVATVDTNGIVTGISDGTATISYSVSNSCFSYTTTKIITVSNAPLAAITGNLIVCSGNTTALNDATTGGIWSSSNSSIATVGATGIVIGMSAGTTTISYSLGTNIATVIVIVNQSPAPIAGSTVCVGSTTPLSDVMAGGVWSSGNAGIAVVDPTTGIVTGVASGIGMITYENAGCFTATPVLVNSLPGVISGNTSPVCAGASITLADAAGAGTWSSDNAIVATVDPVSGILTGITGGTATISYQAGSTGCTTTAIVTIATVLPVSGNMMACIGSNIALSDGTPGGVWSSSNTGVATIDPTMGIVTGNSGGIANITYLVTATGCSSTVTITINTAPASISGASSVCAGNTITLSDAIAGGMWSSDNITVATVNSSGIVTPVNPGTANITYTLGTGCSGYVAVTVNPNPPAITGAFMLCAGTMMPLNDAVAGGVWSSTGTGGSVDISGNVYGLNAGVITVSYQLPTGCMVFNNVAINPLPSSILGNTNICIGSTTSLSDATTGAIGWSSSNTTIATVLNSGIVTGVAAGSSTITYTISTGCTVATTVTVTGLPGPITGNVPVCAGSSITLSDPDGGGTWTSSASAVAVVGSPTGIVTGVSAGTAIITYTTATGCSVTAMVSVNPILPINGTTTACLGATTTLSDGTAGGTWSSSNTSIATISATGIVTGISAGITTITYSITGGCIRTTTVNVLQMDPILGSTSLCEGATTGLSDLTPGGTWSSNVTSVATISSAGNVSGVVAGTTIITYSVAGCKVTQIETVLATPATITGSSTVCIATSVTLSNSTTGGTWSSSTNSFGTIGQTTGVVTGIAAGTTTITYTSLNGCIKTINVTTDPLPASITGILTVCPLGTTTLADATTGSMGWSSSNTSHATVLNSGVVTGVASGTSTITYKIGTGCAATTVVTVIASPSAIIGPFNVCTGSAIDLTDTSGSGTWISSNPGFATVGSSSGIVTGVTAGAPAISFTLSSTGCKTIAVVTVTAIPNAGTLSGPTSVGIGANITLTSSGTAGGAWSSSNGDATVGTSGIVTGVSAGSCTITYAVSNACGYSGAYKPVTVDGSAPRGHGSTTDSTTVFGAAAANQADDVLTGFWGNGNNGIRTMDGNGQVTSSPIDLRIVPNPNNGMFTIKGTLGMPIAIGTNEEVNVEITNILGQLIYKNKLMVQNGVMNAQVYLKSGLTNGMYMLSIKSGAYNKVFHFVVEQ